MTRSRLDQDNELRIFDEYTVQTPTEYLGALPTRERFSSTEMSFPDKWPSRFSARWSELSPSSRDIQQLWHDALLETLRMLYSRHVPSDEKTETDDSLIDLVSHLSDSSQVKNLTVKLKHEPRPSIFKIDIDNDY